MKRQHITQSIQRALKQITLPLEVRLFGSEAKGDARPDSDIDLLVLVDKPHFSPEEEDAIFQPLYQIELQTGVTVNPIIVPKNSWGKRVTPFYINVENEGIWLNI